MDRSCVECGKTFTGTIRKNARTTCSENCRGRAQRRKAGTFSGLIWPEKADGCLACGSSLESRSTHARYCSEKCKNRVSHAKQTAKNRLAIANRSKIECANPYCTNTIQPFNARIYCSRVCLTVGNECRKGDAQGQAAAIRFGQLLACRVHFRACPECAGPVAMRLGNGTVKHCPTCRPQKWRAVEPRKTHTRRASGPPVLSVDQLAERDGATCFICLEPVDMTLSGIHKWGPTVEHIEPVSWNRENANRPDNITLAHRYCNVMRRNRDYSELEQVS